MARPSSPPVEIMWREKVEGSTKFISQLLVRRPLALRSGPRGTERRRPTTRNSVLLHNIPRVKTKVILYHLIGGSSTLGSANPLSDSQPWLLRMTGRSDCIDDTFSGSTKPPSPIRQADTSNSFGCAYRVKPSGGVLEIAYSGSIGSAASIS